MHRKRLLRALLVLCAVLCVLWVRSLDGTLLSPAPSHLLLDRHGKYLGEVPGEGDALGFWDAPAVLPDRIVAATMEAEDRHLFEHAGVYWPSVARAAYQDVRALRIVSGASTVAMQVSRMQHPAGRSLSQKVRELVEAHLLVRQNGALAVLRQYLRLAPYGHRVRGVTRAARLYFDKPVEDLSWRQAAFLAALPQMPGRMDPFDRDGLVRASARAARILRGLNTRGVIDDAALAQALGSDLGLVPEPRRTPEALHATLAWSQDLAARPETTSTATLDVDVQVQAARILKQHAQALADDGAGNAAALVVDLPTGEVLAYVGSTDYFDGAHHGAIDYVQTRRSPGSALKPFVYALGLAQGKFTAATELPDTPLDLQTSDGLAYLPENISHTFLGPMLLREALGNSRNIPAMRVLEQVGVETSLRWFERAGVKKISWQPDAYGLGLAIGTLPVTLEELVGLYGAVANDGQSLPLRRFVDDPAAPPQALLPRTTAQLVRHMLSDALARRPSFPAGGPLDFDYAVAIKTGTSQGHRDAWAVGFSDRLLVGVWVGNHDQRRMNQLTGSRGAAQAVHQILDALTPARRAEQARRAAFAPPEGFVARTVCTLSGRLATDDCSHHKVEYFAAGTEPTTGCPFHARVKLDRRNGLRAGPSCPTQFVETRALIDLPEAYDAWARRLHLALAPRAHSPLCPEERASESVSVAVREPQDHARFLMDPDAPPALSTVQLRAHVTPPDAQVVWLVDGTPFATVGYPFEARWPLSPGTHTIVAALAHQSTASKPVTVHVGR
jgi:penicillin-binding protein 1C